MSDLAPELRVVEYSNDSIVESSYSFVYEDPLGREPSLLRTEHALDRLVAGASSDWEQILRLREWVHSRWDHGWDKPDSASARDLLSAAESGSRFNCLSYALTLCQCATAIGIPARVVHIRKANSGWVAPGEGNIGHVVCELWCQVWRKWVVMDADLNVHYVRGGVPLNALDLHREWESGSWSDITVERGSGSFRTGGSPDASGDLEDLVEDFNRFNSIDYYVHLEWEMRNNFSSSSVDAPRLHWFDNQHPPELLRANEPIRGALWTSSEHDAYWTLNQASISVELVGSLNDPRVRVDVRSSMPDLAMLRIKFEGSTDWIEYTGPVEWRLQPGQNAVRAQSVSVLGRIGPTSRIVYRYLSAGSS